MKPTGVPDGSQTMPKATKPRPIDREGRKNPVISEDYADVKVTEGSSPMHDNLRKGAFGPPIAGKGPTTMPSEETFIPDASTEGAVEKFGLAKGKYGAI